MMKKLTWLFLLGFYGLCQAQNGLPEKIVIVYRSGGDYRYHGYTGMTNVKDSVNYILSSDGTFYNSDQIFHENHKYVFMDGKRTDREENPVWKSTSGYLADTKNVRHLLALLDTARYDKYELNVPSGEEKRENVRSGYRHKEYGWADYGLPENDDCLCGYYRERIREEIDRVTFQYNCGDSARKAAVLAEWMFLNTGNSFMSGSFWALYVDVYFGDKPIRISQVYNGGLNVSWNFIFDDNNTVKKVLSPGLNLAVYRLLPTGFKVKESLLEYKDGYALYRKLLVGW